MKFEPSELERLLEEPLSERELTLFPELKELREMEGEVPAVIAGHRVLRYGYERFLVSLPGWFALHPPGSEWCIWCEIKLPEGKLFLSMEELESEWCIWCEIKLPEFENMIIEHILENEPERLLATL